MQKPKGKDTWINTIWAAVKACPPEPKSEADTIVENNSSNELKDARALTAEEKQRIAKAKETEISKVVGGCFCLFISNFFYF